MSSVAEARQFKAHPEGLEASGTFIPGLAAGGVWRVMEQLRVVSYNDLISTFPVAQIPDIKPIFRSGTPLSEFSLRERFTTTARVSGKKVSVVTQGDFEGSLRYNSDHGFAPRTPAWGYLENHMLRAHGALSSGNCACGVRAYQYESQYGTRLAVNLRSIEAMLASPKRAGLIRGFTSRDSNIFSKWQDLVDLVAEPTH